MAAGPFSLLPFLSELRVPYGRLNKVTPAHEHALIILVYTMPTNIIIVLMYILHLIFTVCGVYMYTCLQLESDSASIQLQPAQGYSPPSHATSCMLACTWLHPSSITLLQQEKY